MSKKQKKTILLASKDYAHKEEKQKCLEKNDIVEIIATTDNGEALVKLAEEHCPDIILMDILLEERDGLWVLEQLQEKQLPSIPIVISAICCDNVVRKAIELGAKYYMMKSIESPLLLERMTQLLLQENAAIKKTSPLPLLDAASKITKEELSIKEKIEEEISVILKRMGIVPSIKGYHFIRKAIMMTLEYQDVIPGLTKELYPNIADAFDSTSGKVERAIRHAIETSWKKQGKEVYSEFAYYVTDQKPTNGQFIAALSEHFRLKYRSSDQNLA